MALFEKKYCDLCGEKVNLLTRMKLSDGFLCSDCKKKVSALSSGWSSRSIDDVKEHLQAREENKSKYAVFNVTASAGRNDKLLVDINNKKFCFQLGRDYTDGNPEVFDFSQLDDYYIKENYRTESDSDNDGIPDSRDNFDNRNQSANVQNGFFNGLMNAMQNNMNQNSAPMNVRQYIRNTAVNRSNLSYVSGVEVCFVVNHKFIKEISFYIDSFISANNYNQLSRAYNDAYAVMLLCEQIRGNAQVQQVVQQPIQQSVQQAVEVMSFCPNCGAKNESMSPFCASCGSSLKK